MALIDRAISLISPRWAAERNAWRLLENSYKGGVPTRNSELWQRAQGFRFGHTGERQNVIDARSRAYNAYENNMVARTLVNTECDNVIGDGLNYQPTSDSPEWNKEAQDRYYRWIENCSVRGADVENGIELQQSIWKQSRVSGDIGWILVSRGYESLVQVISPENIATPDTQLTNKNIYDGIRYDEFGRPVAFNVLTYDEYGKRTWKEIDARDFVYLPHMTKTNQARPPSCYVTIFDLLSHLDRYVDGVSLAAWMATVMGIVFKQNNANKQLSALSTLTNADGNQQKAITFENGMVKYIGTDEDVAQVQAHQPMHQTPEFIRTMYRMLGQPFDMPLEVLAKDMSTCNFASARIGLLPFYRSCRIKAARFGSRWSRTIRWWLSREKQRPDNDKRKWKTAFPENYWDHTLLINAWDYTDPVSEAQSDHLQIDMGTKSVQEVIAERGRDAEQILRERQEWMEKTKDLPTTNSTLTRHPQSGVGAAGDPLGHDAVEAPMQPLNPPPESATNGKPTRNQYGKKEKNGDS